MPFLIAAGLIASNLMRTDNPMFNGGGFVGSKTLAQCQQQCRNTNGCVAIEWSDNGNTYSSGTKRNCALAWGCSDVGIAWSGGTIYRMEA